MKKNNKFGIRYHVKGEPIPTNTFDPQSPAELACQDFAIYLQEQDMRFILARCSQLGPDLVRRAFDTVKEYEAEGKCKNPRALFNYLLTKAYKEKLAENGQK